MAHPSVYLVFQCSDLHPQTSRKFKETVFSHPNTTGDSGGDKHLGHAELTTRERIAWGVPQNL